MRRTFLGILMAIAFFSCSNEGQPARDAAERPDVILPVGELTFHEHVSPIVYQNCTPCHHSEGAAPFALTSYEDLKKRTKTIRQVVADGYMPPWPADPDYSRFRGQKVLTEREKATIINWIDQGAEEGDSTSSTSRPKMDENPYLGEPDLVIHFPDTVNVRGENRDKFRIAKLPLELPRDTFVKAIHFVPGNRQLVHHVNGHLLNYQPHLKEELNSGEWMIDAEAMNSLEAYERMHIAHDDGSYPGMRVSAFNYLPGVEPVDYPEGMGGLFVSRKAALLLNTLHYGPSAVDTFDYSKVEIYFAEKPPERPVKELHMGTQGITPVEPEFVIQAGKVMTFRTEYMVKQPMTVLTVNPHMHLLGKEFEAFAYSSDRRDTIPLIRIPKWDFRWQYFYTYEHPLIIPKGYTIVVEATFDNTIHNPFNPNHPPKTLRGAGKNMRTTDEMFQFFVNYADYVEGDENL